jgi:serine/threonine-protein kinase
MTKQQHISEHDLQLILVEQKTHTPHDQIEAHMADCQDCQRRLMDLAADETWRNEFGSSIVELVQDCVFDETNTHAIARDAIASSPIPAGDEFELRTVDTMLQQLLQSPTHPEMLGRLGRYDVESIIGCGGMGVVMKGFDRELHRPVAIKMILPRLSKHGVAKQRFMREAKAAAAVLHPNVIAIHDISEVDGVPWFVMPLVVGPTLKQVVEQNGTPSHREIARIGLQIASGLAAAHAQGLVHRDIKPANILVDNQVNRIVITDFGLARRETEESMTQTGFLAGTINYMSPEQSRGGNIDGRSDLFSLGSLLYFLATGTTPFRSASAMGVIHQIGNQPHVNVRGENPEVPVELSRAIDCLLEKRPEDRFESATAAEDWFRDYLAFLNQPTEQKAPAVPHRRSVRVSRRALCAASVLLLAGGVWFLPWWKAGGETPNSGVQPPASMAAASGAEESTGEKAKAIAERVLSLNLPAIKEFEEGLVVLTQEIEQAADPAGESIPPARIDQDDTLLIEMERLGREIDRLQDELESSF